MTIVAKMDRRHDSSFRDPSGFLFWHDDRLLRKINAGYARTFDRLTGEGIYNSLFEKGYLVEHSDVSEEFNDSGVIIEPKAMALVTYPYEWCFSQLRDAAQLTLNIQAFLLEKAFSLKDASAFNVQFHNGHPIFIDSLSFEGLDPQSPWIAYNQFCQHFLFPLYLAQRKGGKAIQLLRLFLDGMPRKEVYDGLGLLEKFKPAFLFNVSLPQWFSRKTSGPRGKYRFSLEKHRRIVNFLEHNLSGIKYKSSSFWSSYYDSTHGDAYYTNKEKTLKEFIQMAGCQKVWDIGCNTGHFTFIVGESVESIIATDSDHDSVEKLFRETRVRKTTNILPLVLDILHPSPGIGWQNTERSSFLSRIDIDTIVALALVHHLALSNNIRMDMIAQLFAAHAQHVIIEFVPIDDPKSQLLIEAKNGFVNPDYSREQFEKSFGSFFVLRKKRILTPAGRVLYLFSK